jgi:hypothetical protein
VLAVPRNGGEPVRSNRETPSDSVGNIVKQILGTSFFFSVIRRFARRDWTVENGSVWVFALCGYSALMTRYRFGEVLEVRYIGERGA